jgi:hypothetical protein
MVMLAVALLLYSLGFVFLYGVLRMAVRHGVLDVDQARREALENEQALRERLVAADDAYLTGS